MLVQYAADEGLVPLYCIYNCPVRLPSYPLIFTPHVVVERPYERCSAVRADISRCACSLLTPTEVWPLSRIRVQGADFFRPHIFQR